MSSESLGALREKLAIGKIARDSNKTQRQRTQYDKVYGEGSWQIQQNRLKRAAKIPLPPNEDSDEDAPMPPGYAGKRKSRRRTRHRSRTKKLRKGAK
jgi:hypothetical protein